MGRKLYLHVGPPKTGTSAVQYILREHDNSVVIYPEAGILRGNGHAELVKCYFGRGELENGRAIESLFEKISQETRGKGIDIIISSEKFAKPYGSCQDVAAFINALVPYASDAALDIEIVFACREHFSWAASVYKQRVKTPTKASHPELREPDEFLRDSATQLQYAGLARALTRTGFAVTALNYHPSKDWVKRFLMYVGFAEHQIPEPEMKNVSLGIPALIAKLAANRILPTERMRQRLLRLLQKADDDPQNRAGSDTGLIFGARAAAEAERLFSIDRKFLWDEFGIRLPVPDLGAQESVFAVNASELAELASAARGLGSEGEAVIDIARKFLRT